MPIRTLADITELETVPIWARIREHSVYERLCSISDLIPDHPAIRALLTVSDTEEPRDVSYRELIGKTTQVANLLMSLGSGPDDVVSLLVPLVPGSFFALFGAMTASIANPLNHYLETSHLIGIMKEAGTRVLVVGDPSLMPDLWLRVQAVRAELPSLKAVICVSDTGELPPGILDFDALMAQQPDDHLIAPRQIMRDQVAALFHTGGTTGQPKLARHSHGGLLASMWSNAAVTSTAPDEIFLTGLPLFHIVGALILGLARFACGQTIILPTPAGLRDPNVVRRYWAIVERLKPTVVGGVPTSLAALTNVPDEGHDRSSTRFCLTGAAALPVEVGRRFTNQVGIPVVEGYGLTELHGYATINPQAGDCRLGSVGLRVPYLELKIAEVGADGIIGRSCDPGEVGHVLMRGPQVFAGYLNPQNNHGMLLADGWLDSGDLGRLDADGYLWLTGRSKDLIVRGGHNIDPQILEEVLHRHPAVEVAAAVGCPDSYAGELPVAFVQLRPGQPTSPAELLAFCRKHIPERAAVPVEVIIQPALALTSMGKVYKPSLRLEAARRVFAREAAKLATAGIQTLIEVESHAKHGTLLRLVITDPGSLDLSAAEARCRELLGRYSIHLEVGPTD